MSDAYEAVIREAAKNRDDRDIPNSSVAHAATALSYLFTNAVSGETAKPHVRIMSTCFCRDFWITMLERVKEYLGNEDARLSVALLKPGEKDNGVDLLKLLRAYFGEQVSFCKIDHDKLKAQFKRKADEVPNFCVIEPHGYRFETADTNRHANDVTGVINFGDKEMSDLMIGFFDRAATLAGVPV